MADLIDRDALLHNLKESVKSTREWKEEAQDEEIKIRAEQAHTTFIECALRVKNAPAVNRWIPVEDALPEAFVYVICAGKDGMAILRYNGEVWVDDAGCIYPMSAITHWMHLPEPPKE